MIRILLILTLLLTSTLALGAKSLEWQKIELEKDIRSQYENALASSLKPSEYFVNVEVKYVDPGMPDFKDLNEDNFRISDIKFNDSKGDYIAFSKIGLEVPVLGKSFKANQNHLKEMYRFNESYDLFKNLQSIKVAINLDQSIGEERLEIIKELVGQIRLSYLNFAPSVNFKQIPFGRAVAKKVTPNKDKESSSGDILSLIGRFGNAIGMIITIILLGFIAFKLLKTYMDFMERIKSMENANPASDNNKSQDEENTPAAAPMLNNDGAAKDNENFSINGIQRFEKLLELNKGQALFILKRWISDRSRDSQLALTAVAQQLPNELLSELYSNLTSEQSTQWNEGIESQLEPNELSKANKIISESVIRELISGSLIDDFELMDLILSMDANDVMSYILNNEKYGAYLSNLISSNLLADLMNKLSRDEVQSVISSSLKVEVSEIVQNITDFKNDLAGISKKSAQNPFGKKLATIVKDVAADKEEVLYEYMLGTSDQVEVKNVAMECLPSNVVLSLPSNIVKAIFTDYPLTQKIELLSTIDETMRTLYLDIIGEKGSSAREMIEMELEIISGDELQTQRLKGRSSEILGQYVTFARELLSRTNEFEADIGEVVDKWFDGIASDNTHNNVASIG